MSSESKHEHSAEAVAMWATPVDGSGVCDFEAAVKHVNGDDSEDDDYNDEFGGDDFGDYVFFLDLVSVFYREAVPKLKAICQAAAAFNRGETWIIGEKEERITVEEVLRSSAHAMKGTAANLRLVALSDAAKALEAGGPGNMLRSFSEDTRDARIELNKAKRSEDAGAAADAEARLAKQAEHRAEVLTPLCQGPRTETFDTFIQFRKMIVFIQEVIVPKAKELQAAEKAVPLAELEGITLDSFAAEFIGVPM